MNSTDDEELEKMMKNGDCPAELLDLLNESQSKWRKGVIKQFIQDHIWKKDIQAKLGRIEKENAAIVGLMFGIFSLLLGIALKVI